MSQKKVNACPKCLSDTHVRAKKILIGKSSPRRLFPDFEERAGYKRKDQLAVDECKQDALGVPPLEQFVDGCYCENCGIGFVSDSRPLCDYKYPGSPQDR
jgi:hypothetical protein